MLASERSATAAAAGAAIVEVAGVVEEMQHAITARNFARIGLSGSLLETAHRTHVAGIYLAIRSVARLVATGAGLAVAAGAPPEATSFADSSRGAKTLAGLACAFGDSLQQHGNALAPTMSVRVDGYGVPRHVTALRDAFPQAHNHLIVFIHGLGGTEYAWGAESSYGDQLANEFDVTPVYVRYNSGLSICDNGVEFERLLAELISAWPVEVAKLTLVGHSMGGLIIHRACDIGRQSSNSWVDGAWVDAAWVDRVDEVFCLAAPHRGTALERSAHLLISALATWPITQPLARLFNRRSAGIKDLRHGSIHPNDHSSADKDAREIDGHEDVILLPHANYHFISATILSRCLGPVADAIGDILVTPVSATGRSTSGRRQPLPVDAAHHVYGSHHIGLLTNPEVFALIRNAIAEAK